MISQELLPHLQFPKNYFLEKMSAVIRAEEYLTECDFLIGLFRRQKNGETLLAERKGVAKELLDEMHPIAVFADRYLKMEAPESSIKWNPGNENYDAEIFSPDEPDSVPRYLEVTCIEDQSHHQFREAVAASGSIFKSVNLNYQEEMLRTLNLLHERLKAKCEKPYPHNTALLIYVKDQPLPGWKEAADRVVAQFPQINQKFRRLCIFDRRQTYVEMS